MKKASNPYGSRGTAISNLRAAALLIVLALVWSPAASAQPWAGSIYLERGGAVVFPFEGPPRKVGRVGRLGLQDTVKLSEEARGRLCFFDGTSRWVEGPCDFSIRRNGLSLLVDGGEIPFHAFRRRLGLKTILYRSRPVPPLTIGICTAAQGEVCIHSPDTGTTKELEPRRGEPVLEGARIELQAQATAVVETRNVWIVFEGPARAYLQAGEMDLEYGAGLAVSRNALPFELYTALALASSAGRWAYSFRSGRGDLALEVFEGRVKLSRRTQDRAAPRHPTAGTRAAILPAGNFTPLARILTRDAALDAAATMRRALGKGGLEGAGASRTFLPKPAEPYIPPKEGEESPARGKGEPQAHRPSPQQERGKNRRDSGADGEEDIEALFSIPRPAHR